MTAPTDRSALEKDLLELIDGELSLDPSMPVERDTDLLLSGQVDSLGVVQIVAWLEDRFDLVVDPSDVVLENFQTVGAMVAYVERRLS